MKSQHGRFKINVDKNDQYEGVGQYATSSFGYSTDFCKKKERVNEKR